MNSYKELNDILNDCYNAKQGDLISLQTYLNSFGIPRMEALMDAFYEIQNKEFNNSECETIKAFLSWIKAYIKNTLIEKKVKELRDSIQELNNQ